MLRILKQYYPLRNVFFVFGEGAAIALSVFLSCLIVFGMESFVLDGWLLLKILLITFTCQMCLYYNDFYDFNITDSFPEFGIRLLQALGVAAILLAGIYFILPAAVIGHWVFTVSVGFVILLIACWRLCYRWILDSGIFDQKIILLGSDELGGKIREEIKGKKDCGYAVAAWMREGEAAPDSGNGKTAMVAGKPGYEGLCELAENLGIKKIVVALREKRGAFPVKELLKCRVNGISVIEGASFYEMLTGKLIVNQINPGWLIFSEGFHKSRSKRFFKRLADILLSLALLIVFLPLILLTAVMIKLDSRGPVFFSQERVGKNRRAYRMHKFRSMVADAEKLTGPVWAADNDDRITRTGKWIRKFRIDEVPQLWNVLKGEMSFVGPRPEREFFVKELENLVPYYAERFTVKPGITGWAQVGYGYGASVEDAVEKLNYDLFYIKNMSLFMDVMVLARTVKTVLFSKGAR
jgi:sugar transferase (PEP-CTERM system associated)